MPRRRSIKTKLLNTKKKTTNSFVRNGNNNEGGTVSGGSGDLLTSIFNNNKDSSNTTNTKLSKTPPKKKTINNLFGSGNDNFDGDLLTSIFKNSDGSSSSSSDESSSSSDDDDSSGSSNSSDDSCHHATSGNNKQGGGNLFSNTNVNKWKRLSQDRMKQNEQTLCKKRKIQKDNKEAGVSPSKTRDDILQTRRCQSGNLVHNDNKNDNEQSRAASCKDIIKSLTVPIPDMEVGNDNDDEDDKEGEMRLFAGQCSSIFRSQGMLILQSPSSSSSTSSKKESNNDGEGMLFSSSLLSSLCQKAQSIEQKLCQRLEEKGNTKWKVPSTSHPQQEHNNNNKNDDTKNEQNLDMERLHHFQYNEVASRCLGRLDVRYGMNQEPFQNTQIINNPYIMSIVRNLLGGGHRSKPEASLPKLVYAGLILSFPNSADQPWHQDGGKLFEDDEFFHYAQNVGGRHTENNDIVIDLPPYALNVFIPLEDVTEELGPTEFLVQSHLQSKTKELNQVLTAGADLLADDNDTNNKKISMPLIGPTLKCGDALFYDYRICHRGTQNLSTKGQTRPMLYLMYARPWFHEHLNFGKERLFPEA